MSAAAATVPVARSEPTRAEPTCAETVVAALARQIEDGMVIATGVASWIPILAIAVARATHAPRLNYIACVGALDPALTRLYPSAEDLAFLDGRVGEVSIPDLFDHARRGRIDAMFFGAAEIDGFGDTNLSAAGSLERPIYKFPGVAGAATLRRWVRRPILWIGRQSRRNLVPQVQVASTRNRSRRTPLYTDLGVFEVGGDGARLRARHPWATVEEIRDSTGFGYEVEEPLAVTPKPSAEHLDAIRSIDVDNLRERMIASGRSDSRSTKARRN
ncbi:MAG: CoA-transferase [Thermoanaerobaculia bacterium]